MAVPLTGSISLSPKSLASLKGFYEAAALATGLAVEEVVAKAASYEGLAQLGQIAAGGDASAGNSVRVRPIGKVRVDVKRKSRNFTRRGVPRGEVEVKGASPAGLEMTHPEDAAIILRSCRNMRSRSLVTIEGGKRAQCARYRETPDGAAQRFRLRGRLVPFDKDPAKDAEIRQAMATAFEAARPVMIEGGPGAGFVKAAVWPGVGACVLESTEPLRVQDYAYDAPQASVAGVQAALERNQTISDLRSALAVGNHNAVRVETDAKTAARLHRSMMRRLQANHISAQFELAREVPTEIRSAMRRVSGLIKSDVTNRGRMSSLPFDNAWFVKDASKAEALRLAQACKTAPALVTTMWDSAEHRRALVLGGVRAGQPVREIARNLAKMFMEEAGEYGETGFDNDGKPVDPRIVRAVAAGRLSKNDQISDAVLYLAARPRSSGAVLLLDRFGIDSPHELRDHSNCSKAVKAYYEMEVRSAESRAAQEQALGVRKSAQLSEQLGDVYVFLQETLHRLGIFEVGMGEGSVGGMTIAKTMLYPEGIGPSGLMELNRVWHRDQSRDVARLLAMKEEFQKENLGIDKVEAYPHVLLKQIEIDGAQLTPLTSARSLVEEGEALRHCVGSYAARASTGQSMIVKAVVDGERSTAELAIETTKDKEGIEKPRLVISQHKGERNSDPAVGNQAAVHAFVRAVNAGAVIEGVRDLAETGVATRQAQAARKFGSADFSQEQLKKYRDLTFETLKPYLTKSERLMDRIEWVEKGIPARLEAVARSHDRQRQPRLRTAGALER